MRLSVQLRILISLYLLLTVIFSCPGALAKSALNFSRSLNALRSPDGVYVIRNLAASANIDSDLLYVETPDQLVFARVDNRGGSSKLLQYHRNVDVLWAPDSKSFVVNDWKSSDTCNAYVYKLGSLKGTISLKQRLMASGISAKQKSLLTNRDHSYIFVERWQSPQRLVVKAAGHYFIEGKTVAYTLQYLWDMKSNKWILLKKNSFENLERGVPNMAHFGA